eukprot:4320016-Heterocapsa_arctica.AAC.1
MLPGGCAHWPQEEYGKRPVFDHGNVKKWLAQKPLNTFQNLQTVCGEGFPQKPSKAQRGEPQFRFSLVVKSGFPAQNIKHCCSAHFCRAQNSKRSLEGSAWQV